MTMRRTIFLLVAFALAAVSCGGSTDSTASDEASASAADGETASESGDGAEESSEDQDSNAAQEPAATLEPTGTEETTTASPASADDAPVCGFETGLTAYEITVDQIPGDGRGDNPSALENPLNAAFPDPLVDLDRILSGGPPPDGIPPIDNPIFQTASTVDWLKCNEPVLSLEVNGEARAYPVQVMTWHELVNDTFGDVPVTVSYCPLCNSALAYNRDLGDRIVTFGTSGKLFNSSLVMYDRETESMWTHFNGGAVVGDLTGTQLELLPMQTTSWNSFLTANPDGLVLTRNTGFDRNYGTNPYFGYDDVTTDPFLFDGDADPRLAAKERVVGIRRDGASVAVVLEGLADVGVLETEVAGDVLTVWHLPGTATALEQNAIADGRDIGAVGVFLPDLEGQALTFSREGDGFIDDQTGSTWNITGHAIDGELAGEQLQAVEHIDTFWFALAAFEPDTEVVQA